MSVTVPSAGVEMPPDFLRIADLTPEALRALLSTAAHMKAHPRLYVDAFKGNSVSCFFEKPSTRTRVSFEVAAHRLGLLPIMLRPDELQLGRGEPIEDTARVLAGYSSAIVMRVFSQETLERVAGASDVPVVNALSDAHHPCQALADLLTLRETHGELAGLCLTYVGDGNNVAHSLMEAGALAGMHVTVACPADYRPSDDVVVWADRHAAANGGSITVTDDPRDAVRDADAVYTDVWVSMGDEETAAERLDRLAAFQVTDELMGLAADGAVFLHCLPAHRGQEVAASVIDGPRSRVFQQAANRMPTEQAVLFALLAAQRRADR
jgi:ornithine carbamoyltransferase